ncbi:transcription antitermination factor NusB [Halobacteroides halobius DSM 5150]|uniref:Transcription antitermination protein NusB n=1 Tax=Halobacteroides halobius (strain ATCC 35273 / DSM 5150 / MD-1) TaxID=748449 RepID=L0K7J7_HALHC|nr:transcription antitermination factor NusB [Halobacteroides halobius]AGB40520.1 transcription antitermination factor NusB [Halobacteroides halobius DSM 5150]
MVQAITRRQAREVAVQFLYQVDINKAGLVSNLDTLHEERPELDLRGSFLSDIIEGTYHKKHELDQLVDDNISNWKMERMGKVERNIIRLALYEMLYEEEIPTAVSIDEAIELAKSFSDQKAAKFVNGILGKLAKKLDLKEEE